MRHIKYTITTTTTKNNPYRDRNTKTTETSIPTKWFILSPLKNKRERERERELGWVMAMGARKWTRRPCWRQQRTDK